MIPELVMDSLGVSADLLSAQEKARLDDDGFLVFPDLLSPDDVTALMERVDELSGRDDDPDIRRREHLIALHTLVNKGSIFDQCVLHPKVLSAIVHVLGRDIKLSSLNSLFLLPGCERQVLHVDFETSIKPGDWKVANSLWLLDDFTPNNGATRFVPGSQRTGELPGSVLEDRKADHPDQVQVLAPAGSVAVFNAHTWHGFMDNSSSSPRRAIHSYYTLRECDQQTNQRDNLSPETKARFSPEVRTLLDVD